MSEDPIVTVRYRGLDLGQDVRIGDFSQCHAYMYVLEPMPVGTVISISVTSGLEIDVRVNRVNEQAEGIDAPPGMHVTAVKLDGPAREWWEAQSQS